MKACLRTPSCLRRGPISARARSASRTEHLALRPWSRPLRLLDSITEAAAFGPGAVVVSGSHGGLSTARFALQAALPGGVQRCRHRQGRRRHIAALPWLQQHGIAALAVAHDSARIGEADSTWQDGVISAVNDGAAALGARPGLALRPWLQSAVLSAA